MKKIDLEKLIVNRDITIRNALQIINESGERILFVVDDADILVSTISDGDVRRGMLAGRQFDEPVSAIAQHDFKKVRSSDARKEELAREIMLSEWIQYVPVIDDEGKMLDVILWRDIIESERKPRATEHHQNTVVIMAGGKGTRMEPFTRILPKALVPLGKSSVLEIIIENFASYGFENFVVALNFKKEYIKLYLSELELPYNVQLVEEEDFLGTMGALSLLKDRLTETFFVINCDTIIETDLNEALKWHKQRGSLLTIVGCHNEVKIPFGVLEAEEGRLKEIREKPVHDVLINTGLYIIEPEALDGLEKGKKADITDLISSIQDKAKVHVYPIYGGWFDIGQWEEYRSTLVRFGGNENI